MLVNFLVLILIVLVTAYYANQGLFSATLSLIAAIFGSILAMGLFEPLQGMIGGYKPAYARGTTFLLVFLFALSACRIGADFAVPKAIRFSKLIDSISGAFVGFFAALVIVGTCFIGLDMMPLRTSLMNVMGMGFDRYPEGMTAAQPGIADSPRNLWFMPDRFTETIWNGASGRGLGGSSTFASVHPDLTVESYGYRNSVEYTASSVLVPDLLKVSAAYVSDSPELLAKCDIKDSGKQAVVIRTEVEKGIEQPKASSDIDGMYRISASQIRLVTDKGQQYYPIGHLLNGTKFEALPLDSGHLIDDYVENRQTVEDWVFETDREEKPKFVEVKQLARVDLAGKLSPKPVPALAAAAYPKREYRTAVGDLTVTVTSEAGPIADMKVLLLPESTKVGAVKVFADPSYAKITETIGYINEGSGPWAAAAGQPGVPSRDEYRAWQTRAQNSFKNKAPTEETQWVDVVPVVIMGFATKPNGSENVAGLDGFWESNVVRFLNQTNDVRAQGVTNAKGIVEFKGLAPGKYAVIAAKGTNDWFYHWAESAEIKKKQATNTTLSTGRSTLSFVLKKP